MLGSSSKGAVKRGKNLDSFFLFIYYYFEDDVENKPALNWKTNKSLAHFENTLNIYRGLAVQYNIKLKHSVVGLFPLSWSVDRRTLRAIRVSRSTGSFRGMRYLSVHRSVHRSKRTQMEWCSFKAPLSKNNWNLGWFQALQFPSCQNIGFEFIYQKGS